MAIGDYSKTTYANGAAPAINATNLNNNENKVKELDTAVDGLETTVSGNTYDIFTLETTVSGLEAREIPVSTSSRIFDLSGDRVPPIPDDPAGVTYQNIQNFTNADGWTANNCTLSYSGGKMIITSTNAAFSISRTVTASRLVMMKIRKVSSAGTGSKIANSTGTDYSNTKLYGNNIEHIHVAYIGSGATGVLVLTPAASGGAIGDVYEISEIYIGTGAYLSKLVDRAGVPWTNVGALPVDGPFGKGLQFNGAQYMQAPGPMIGTTGTIAVDFKLGQLNPSTAQVLFDNRSASNTYGLAVIQNTNNTILVSVRDGSTTTTNTHTAITDLLKHSIVIDISGTTLNSMLDSQYLTSSLSSAFYSDTPLVVGRGYNGAFYFTGTIYAVRADSRVWTDEEIARWSRDPYSEESIPMSSTPTANALVQWPSSGNFGSGSGLDADLLQGIAGNRYHKNVTGATTDQSVDWNTLIENGSYSIAGASSINGPNGPTGLYGYGTLLVFTVNDMRTQIYIPHQSTSNNLRDRRIVFRNTYAPPSLWQPWAELFSERTIGTNWATALATTYGSMARIPISTKTGTGSGTAGDIAADSSYLYVCTATNTWKRVALSSF